MQRIFKSSLGLGYSLVRWESTFQVTSSEDTVTPIKVKWLTNFALIKQKKVSESDRHSSVYKLKNYAIH